MITPQRWQTWRTEVTNANGDTQLTDYIPADLTDAVKAKMIDVTNVDAIAIRAFGVGDANDSAGSLMISGWMDPFRSDAGPGVRILIFTPVLGTKTFTGLPLTDGKWISRSWKEADQYTLATPDLHGVTRHGTALNLEGFVSLPVFAYTHLLLEIPSSALGGASEPTILGIMWRPLVGVTVTV